jgi:hypothetical protein
VRSIGNSGGEKDGTEEHFEKIRFGMTDLLADLFYLAKGQ